ncbi:hypothetical protein AB4Y77_05995 [Paenarthrobacter sp. YAF11_1]|uniref:hypothetical protein n=1 Tax=Paenarthrobacter sp. YAF11_1 TaxID=3233074 RepID=UPI003F9E1259
MTRTNRTFKRAALAAGILLSLAACTPPILEPTPAQTIPHDAASGQKLAEAREAIEAIPGISVTNFTGGNDPNIKGNTGYSIWFRVDPGYTLQAGDVLVDYIVRNVWSVGEGYMPNTQIQISSSTADGEPLIDLSAAGVGSAWTGGPASAPSQHSTIIIPLSADDPDGARNISLLTKDGPWPGVTPKPLPDNVTAKVG